MRVRFWPALRRAGIGGCVVEEPLRLDRRELDPGRPVVLCEGHPPRAYYDPNQISRECALQVLEIVAPVADGSVFASGGEGSRGGTTAGCPPGRSS